MPSRRTFVKVGLAGATLFALARLGSAPAAAATPAYRLLDDKAAGIVKALAPIVLARALPDEAASLDRALNAIALSFDRAASSLSPPVQREVTDLFSFLDFPPTRIAFARLWSPVGESTPEELRAFLTRWRESRFELQLASYQALTQLIHASWYDMPESWPAVSYPGPPPLGLR
ncbi:MAG TPA: hypothetical protein VGI57_00445 [Usitatibacter sp.]|jgi:hypothetical protein